MITLTDNFKMPEETLTGTQQTALSSLILGSTVSEAAGEAGVHRNTVHRWLKSDEPFQTARHRAQRDARMAVEAKLHDTATAAVDCLEKCLLEGDAYVAEQLLKGLGCFDGRLKNLGKDDAVELALEALQRSAPGGDFPVNRAPIVGARSEIGSRKSAQAEGSCVGEQCDSEHLQHAATFSESAAGVDTASPPPAPTSDLRSSTLNLQHDAPSGDALPERYQSVMTMPEDPALQGGSTSRQTQPDLPNVQHGATLDEGFVVEHEGQSQEIHAYADLTVQQTTAMFALQTGQTLSEAAHCADTDLATVTQWLRGDCMFQAAMNRCGRERRESIQARLSQLASKAADVIDLKVIQGNGRVAVKLLKGLGYLRAGV